MSAGVYKRPAGFSFLPAMGAAVKDACMTVFIMDPFLKGDLCPKLFPSGAQGILPQLVQGGVDLHQIVDAVGNKKLDDQIAFGAGRKGITGSF